MELDLQELEAKPTNKIPGFLGRLKKQFPGMYEHRCSVGEPGGFFQRVKEGTWMGHVIEHLALEIQTLAGMDVGFGRTRGTGEKGVYNVVFAYMEEKVGIYAGKISLKVAEALIRNKTYDLAEDIQTMREIRENERLGPSTGSIVVEALSRNIPYIRLNKYSLCQLGYGANQKRIQATVSSDTSSIAVELAGDKEDSKNLLDMAEVPVPKGTVVRTETGLREAVNYLGYPVVVKPIDGNHGRGITADVSNMKDAIRALKKAMEVSRSVIVEKYITGDDYRLLVIDYKLVAAAKRTPAHVIGNGKSTVQALIDEVNKDPRRGYGHEKVLTMITVNKMTEDILKLRGYTTKTILKKGETLYLKDTANLSTGGTAADVFEFVHPYNVFMAERIARIIGLDICGIDIMTNDINMPLEETGGAVLEVNAGPGFRMHLAPTEGLGRNVAAYVVDMLFPPGINARIPIISITGTNGKTTTTRLIAHIMKMVGYRVGYTTSDGVYIQNRMLMKGDCTGPASARFVLKDPTVNMAVLETARGGLLRAGLAFDHCDVGIVTNVAADHLGLKGIQTVEHMARVKAVIPESVAPSGYAILNADDDLVFNMRKGLDCTVVLFSMNEDNPRIKRHAANGGISAIYENGYITICKGDWKYRIEKAVNIPLTFGGKAAFNIQNILPAVLAAYLQGLKLEDIRSPLGTFIPSPAQTPGRMNLFHFKNFDVLVDFAHNPAGMRALQKFVDNTDATVKVGIIAGIGDRRDEDTIEVGKIASEMFDEVIIRQDKNLRGKSEEELIGLMEEGIRAQNSDTKITVIPNETKAINHALKNAKDGSLITMCSDVVPDALELVMQFKEKEAENLYEFTKEDIPNLE